MKVIDWFFDDGSEDPFRKMAKALTQDERFVSFLRETIDKVQLEIPEVKSKDVARRVARNRIFKAVSEAVEASIIVFRPTDIIRTKVLSPETQRMFYYRSRQDRLRACLMLTDRAVRSIYG